jgi:heterodisulfide reductase subunit A-like polyferredoxin
MTLYLSRVALCCALAISAAAFDPFSNVPTSDIIVRDVCIIGGGSSGIYSAIQLRDHGKSVAIVEKKDRLGGHTETYHDPVTGQTVDIGVIVWHDLDIVKD